MKRYLILVVLLIIISNRTAIGNNDSLGIQSIDYYEKSYSTFKSENNPDSVLYYANMLVAKFDIINDTIKKLEYYEQTCNYLIERSQYRLVANLLNRFVSDAEESGKEYFIATAYFQIGRFLALAKINNQIALEYYNRSLSIFQSNANYANMALVYYDLGLYYGHIDKKEKLALTNFLKSVEINTEHKYYLQLYDTYRALAELYRHRYKD